MNTIALHDPTAYTGILTRADQLAPTSIEAITTRTDALTAEADTILTRADGPDLEGDDLDRFTEITTELDQLATRRRQLETIDRHRTSPTTETGGPIDTRHRPAVDPFDLTRAVSSSTPADIKARALTAIEQTRHIDDTHKNAATAVLERTDTEAGAVARHIVATGRPLYRSAFMKIAAGAEAALTTEERAAVTEARAASLANGSGGFAVPYTLDPTLILTNAGSANPWRQLARVVPTTTNEWRGVATAGVTASWDGEATEASDDAPTLTQPTINAHKAQAFVPFSIEVGADWPGMETELRSAFMDAKDRLEADAFAVGAGDASNQPEGIIPAVAAVAGSVVASQGTDTFAIDDVWELQATLPPRFRPAAAWVAELETVTQIRRFGDTNGYPLFGVDMSAGTMPQLLGRPVHESSSMDGTIDAAAENYVLLYGDIRNAYTIVDRVGLTVEVVPHLIGNNGRPTGQRGLYAYWRVGGGVVNANAVRLLNVT